MTLTYARIAHGLVAELIEIDGEPPIEERFHPDVVATCRLLNSAQAAAVRPGWRVDGVGYAAPSAEAPALRVASVRAVAFRLALTVMPPPDGSPEEVDDMEDAVSAAVAQAPKVVRIAWAHGSRVMRADLIAMAPLLGAAWTGVAIDAALTAAASLPDAEAFWEPVP